MYTTRNAMGNIISGSYYELAINDSAVNHMNSRIFLTSKKSRWAALDYFRLRLPLANNRHIRVNPDHDVLFFHPAHDIRDINILAAILHDIKAYDPRDQGLKHLAILGDTLFPDKQPVTGEVGNCGSNRPIDSTSAGGAGKITLSHPIAQASLTDILSTKLRTLWCVQKMFTRTRVYGPGIYDRPVGMPQWMETLPMLPPLSRLGISHLNFEWIENDPRPIEPDIGNMPFFKDPRQYHYNWKVIEEVLGVRHVTPFRVFACVFSELAPAGITGHMTEPTGLELRVRQLVESNRQMEKDEWERAINHWVNLMRQIRPLSESTFDESWFRERNVMLDRDDMTAIGMWLFPAEAFGRVDDHNFAEVYHSYKMRAKSSVTPGLALFDLSSLTRIDLQQFENICCGNGQSSRRNQCPCNIKRNINQRYLNLYRIVHPKDSRSRFGYPPNFGQTKHLYLSKSSDSLKSHTYHRQR
ncbi:hypothetical protein BHYA_0033g00450 [Botrytis hyacinthi]|uniref:Uncharacterized protein n=1 Tax=Botrytis hyacinthi TaxID=278943 RepID=A0A4Z1GZN2_9HELO|nr:hypothetical protein BHYA_0033g00450 [Botrytis hyacinthi]